MYKEHSEFIINEDNNTSLWRYMEFWKFLNLLNSSELHFSYVNDLGDQHEGRIPSEILELLRKDLYENSPEGLDGYVYTLENLRSKTLVCCWSKKESESFALWKMYAKDKLGIAIKTSFNGLCNCFNNAYEDIYIGEVQYYSPKYPNYRLGNTFSSFLVKHNYYEYEMEVRCITEKEAKYESRKNHNRIKVILSDLIEEVYVSPFAYNQTDLISIIEYLKEKYSLKFQIKISGVNDHWL